MNKYSALLQSTHYQAIVINLALKAFNNDFKYFMFIPRNDYLILSNEHKFVILCHFKYRYVQIKHGYVFSIFSVTILCPHKCRLDYRHINFRIWSVIE